MTEIVERSGLSKGGFYYYFDSKEKVFTDVIAHLLGGIMHVDYSQLGQSSLKGFYTGLIQLYDRNHAAMQKLLPGEADGEGNFYYLIFDAMRLLPDFKKQQLERQKAELQMWKSVVNTARNSYEINTNMNNEQVAKLFIYLSDGITINRITGEPQPKNQLKDLWDNLFFSLRG